MLFYRNESKYCTDNLKPITSNSLRLNENLRIWNLKFDNVEDEWNNFGKIVCVAADGVLGKKVRNAARNISEMKKRRRGLYRNYLSDISYENTKNVNNVLKALKYKLRRCEVKVRDEIAEDLEDAARRHNSKMLYWHADRVVNLDLSQLKIGMEPQLVIRKELKRDE